jgi:hypothetical protein
MKFNKTPVRIISALAFLSLFSGCGGSSPSSSGGCPAANTSCTTAAPGFQIPNPSSSTIPIYVADQSTTGKYGYSNEPLVSVTICTPNHTSSSQCQTISNVLLDTGSYGLRLFSQVIAKNVQLAQQTVNEYGQTKNLAECALFGSGADWGSVQNGDVTMGSQTASNIPIQVIDINYGQIPDGCAQFCPDTDPCTAGYNGILGVGLFAQDCGTECANYTSDTSNPGIYFGCDDSGCFDGIQGNCGSDGVCMYTVGTNQQVINPVSSFSTGFNNGVSLTLPSVGAAGASGVTGTLTLGIGSPSSATAFLADSGGMTDGNGADFTTVFQGTTYGGRGNSDNSNGAFIDSGSNGLFFSSGISTCATSTDFYCGGGQSFSATMYNYDPHSQGATNAAVAFTVGNADALFNSGNSCFSTLAGPSSLGFDWGLPFFFGRTVYVGLDGTSATVGGQSTPGPYWAF